MSCQTASTQRRCEKYMHWKPTQNVFKYIIYLCVCAIFELATHINRHSWQRFKRGRKKRKEESLLRRLYSGYCSVFFAHPLVVCTACSMLIFYSKILALYLTLSCAFTLFHPFTCQPIISHRGANLLLNLPKTEQHSCKPFLDGDYSWILVVCPD